MISRRRITVIDRETKESAEVLVNNDDTIKDLREIIFNKRIILPNCLVRIYTPQNEVINDEEHVSSDNYLFSADYIIIFSYSQRCILKSSFQVQFSIHTPIKSIFKTLEKRFNAPENSITLIIPDKNINISNDDNRNILEILLFLQGNNWLIDGVFLHDSNSTYINGVFCRGFLINVQGYSEFPIYVNSAFNKEELIKVITKSEVLPMLNDITKYFIADEQGDPIQFPLTWSENQELYNDNLPVMYFYNDDVSFQALKYQMFYPDENCVCQTINEEKVFNDSISVGDFKNRIGANDHLIAIENIILPDTMIIKDINMNYPNKLLCVYKLKEFNVKIINSTLIPQFSILLSECSGLKMNKFLIHQELCQKNPIFNKIVPDMIQIFDNENLVLDENHCYKNNYLTFIITLKLHFPSTEIFAEKINLYQDPDYTISDLQSIDLTKELCCEGKPIEEEDLFSGKLLHFVDKISGPKPKRVVRVLDKKMKEFEFDLITSIKSIRELIYNTQQVLDKKPVILVSDKRLLYDHEQLEYIPEDSILEVLYEEPQTKDLCFIAYLPKYQTRKYHASFVETATLNDVLKYIRNYNIGINFYDMNLNLDISINQITQSWFFVQTVEDLPQFDLNMQFFDTCLTRTDNQMLNIKYENEIFDFLVPITSKLEFLAQIVAERFDIDIQDLKLIDDENRLLSNYEDSTIIKSMINVVQEVVGNYSFQLPTEAIMQVQLSNVSYIQEITAKITKMMDCQTPINLFLNSENGICLQESYFLYQYYLNPNDLLYIQIQEEKVYQKSFMFRYMFQDTSEINQYEFPSNIPMRKVKFDIWQIARDRFERNDITPRHISIFAFNHLVPDSVFLSKLNSKWIFEVRIQQKVIFSFGDKSRMIKHFPGESTIEDITNLLSLKCGPKPEDVIMSLNSDMSDPLPLDVEMNQIDTPIFIDTRKANKSNVFRSLSLSQSIKSLQYTLGENNEIHSMVISKYQTVKFYQPNGISETHYFDKPIKVKEIRDKYSKLFNIGFNEISFKSKKENKVISDSEYLPNELEIECKVGDPIEYSFDFGESKKSYHFTSIHTALSAKRVLSKEFSIDVDIFDLMNNNIILNDDDLISKQANNQFTIVYGNETHFELPYQSDPIIIYCHPKHTVKQIKYKLAKKLQLLSPIPEIRISDTAYLNIFSSLEISLKANEGFLIEGATPFGKINHFNVILNEKPFYNNNIILINCHASEAKMFNKIEQIPIDSTLNSLVQQVPNCPKENTYFTFNETVLSPTAPFYSFEIFSGEINITCAQTYEIILPDLSHHTLEFHEATKVSRVKEMIAKLMNIDNPDKLTLVINGFELVNDCYIQNEHDLNEDHIVNVYVKKNYFFQGHKPKCEDPKKTLVKINGFFTITEAPVYINAILGYQDRQIVFYYQNQKLSCFDEIPENSVIKFKICYSSFFYYKSKKIKLDFSSTKQARMELIELINNFPSKDYMELVLILKRKIFNDSRLEEINSKTLIMVEHWPPIHISIEDIGEQNIFEINPKLKFCDFMKHHSLVRLLRSSDITFECENKEIPLDSILSKYINKLIEVKYKKVEYKIAFRKRDNIERTKFPTYYTVRDFWLFECEKHKQKKGCPAAIIPDSVLITARMEPISMKDLRRFLVDYKLNIDAPEDYFGFYVLIFVGKYANCHKQLKQIKSNVAIGSQASISKVKHPVTGKYYVTKKYRNNMNSEFIREISLLYRLRHPTVLKMVDISIQDRVFVTKFMINGTLDDFMGSSNKERYHEFTSNKSNRFTTLRYKISYGIAYGLEFIHSNHVMHCDLKPLNIFLNKHNNPKIGDFGIAVISGISSPLAGGNAPYLAPEIVNNNSRYTFKSDVYSFGVILYELYTATVLDRADYQKYYKKDFSFDFSSIDDGQRNKKTEELILKCTDRDPKKRPEFSSILDEMRNEDTFFIGTDVEVAKRFDSNITRKSDNLIENHRMPKSKSS